MTADNASTDPGSKTPGFVNSGPSAEALRVRLRRLRHTLADLGEHEVRLELLGGERGSVRLTALLARDLEVSPMTLSEINAANAGLVGIRIWIDAGRVLAGIDLPYAHLSDLSSEIDRLLDQVEGLGLFLGALSDVH